MIISLGLASGRFGSFYVLAEGSFEYDSEKHPLCLGQEARQLVALLFPR